MKTGRAKKIVIITVILCGILLVTFASGISAGETAPGGKKAPIYNPDLDVNAEITRALARALDENRHVLLMFGGNWCPWCHRLHDIFISDRKIKKFLEDRFLLILVDVGEEAGKPLNRDLVDKYRVQGFGYPSLAVLDSKGRLIAAQSTGVLEKGPAHDPERVMAFLKAQAPGPVKEPNP